MGRLSAIRHKLQKVTYLLPALRLVWQSSPRWTTVQVLLMMMQGALPLAQIYTAKLIVDTVSLGSPQTAESAQRLMVLVALLGVTLLSDSGVGIIRSFASNAQSQQFMDYMSGVLHEKSLSIDLAFYENPQYRDTLQRAQQQATYRPNNLLQNLIGLTQNAISLLLMGGLLLTLHWGIALVVVLASVPTLLVRVRNADVRYRWQRRRTSLERRSSYLSWLMIEDVSAKEVRLFNLGRILSQRFNRLRRLLYGEKLSINRRFALTSLFSQSVSTLLTIVAYGYVVYRAFQGSLSVGDLVLYYEALQRGQKAFKASMSSLSALYEDNLFLSNLYEFLNLQPQIVSLPEAVAVPTPMRQGLMVEDLDFSYAGSSRQALHNINLHIRPGEVIALVGENGSGKTTLIKLLCRLYDPNAGRITLDGIDLRELDVEAWRQQISVIFQDYVKYFMSAQENIWLGNVELPMESILVREAAARSGADAVIRSLPHQYDTMLGRWFDEGEELSIGQWQKVALARAFLRESQIVVLDEPTSAMDPKAEYAVFQSFRKLIRHQAAILISHRLSTVKMADRIYLMDGGRIIESGSHDELISRRGRYADLFETQAKSYR